MPGADPSSSVFVYLILQMQGRAGSVFIHPLVVSLAGGDRPPQGKLSPTALAPAWRVSLSKICRPGLRRIIWKLSLTASFVLT